MKKKLLLPFITLAVLVVTFNLLAPTAQSQPENESVAWKVDTVHTSVLFRIKHMSTSNFWGRFNEFGGSFVTGPDPSFDFFVKTESIDTNSEGRDKVLRSNQFFFTQRFPEFRLKSTGFAEVGEGKYEATADLSMKGKTAPVTVMIEKVGEHVSDKGHRIGYDATFTIKRSEFNMKSMLDNLGDEVTVVIGLQGIREK